MSYGFKVVLALACVPWAAASVGIRAGERTNKLALVDQEAAVRDQNVQAQKLVDDRRTLAVTVIDPTLFIFGGHISTFPIMLLTEMDARIDHASGDWDYRYVILNLRHGGALRVDREEGRAWFCPWPSTGTSEWWCRDPGAGPKDLGFFPHEILGPPSVGLAQ